jgi:hypothetical protein
MQIGERSVGDVVILDLKGKITLGEGDELLKDKVNSLANQGQKKIVLNLADVPQDVPRAKARRLTRSCMPEVGSGCQRSRSNSSSDTLSCRRILKNSGGPISRPPCSGMVTDRPSLCVQRSWLPVWRRLTKPRASAAR